MPYKGIWVSFLVGISRFAMNYLSIFLVLTLCLTLTLCLALAPGLSLVLATLLAATGLVAQAQVTISGKYSIWEDSTKTGSARSGSVVTDPTSNINITAKEDLGGGLKAIALLENDFQAQNKEDEIGKGADQGRPVAAGPTVDAGGPAGR